MPRRHYYPSRSRVWDLSKKEGPLAAVAAEAGGTLVVVPQLSAKPVGRGCGTNTPVVGTSGKAPCGCFVTDLCGNREEHLCAYCAGHSY